MPGDALARFPPERLHEVVFEAHPAAAIVTSDWPIATIVSNHRQGMDLTGVDMQAGESALVSRPDIIVEIRTLPDGGAAFLTALIQGEALGFAAEKASADSKNFDLAISIGGTLEAGIFTGVDFSDHD